MEIVRLSEMPEDTRKKLEDHMAALNYPKPRAEFNEFGLRYDIEHLNEVGGAVSLLPLEYSANYVDVVSKGSVDAGEPFVIDQPPTPECFEKLNATAVGNIAYAILNAKNDEKSRVGLMDFYNAYQNWYLEKMADVLKKMAKA